jgi:ElaB/YqjD/DUF883 family membrane-anchored ribosome-binding protein
MNAHFSKLDLDDLKKEIHVLLKATANVADETVLSARKRLSNALGELGHGAECAGKFVKGHPCETAILALLAGVVAGLIISRGSD